MCFTWDDDPHRHMPRSGWNEGNSDSRRHGLQLSPRGIPPQRCGHRCHDDFIKRFLGVPFGKLTVCELENHYFNRYFDDKWAIFNSKPLNYQRVPNFKQLENADCRSVFFGFVIVEHALGITDSDLILVSDWIRLKSNYSILQDTFLMT